MFSMKPAVRPIVWLLVLLLSLPSFSGVVKADTNEGLVDDLDNFNSIYSHTANLVLDSSNAQNMGGDLKRITRNSTDTGSLVYKTDYDITSFTVPAYFWTGTPVVDVQFYGSADGVDYTPVTPKIYTSGPSVNSWQMYVYEAFGLPAGTRYLKIQLLGDVKYWTPQISKVILNLNTASVEPNPPSETVIDGSQTLVLSTATPGAAIYYKRNTDTAYQLYQAPITLTTGVAIDTYAQKEGLSPSFVQTLYYPSKSDWQIDRYGQVIKADFPEKVTDDAQLTQDAADDQSYYDSLQVPSDRDAYGGLKDSAQQYGLTATGFFSIQQTNNGRTVMVTPDGNVFYSLGVNGITTNETYVQTSGRKNQFEWIPPQTGEFASAFRASSTDFSYYIANRIRKFGAPYDDEQFVKQGMDRIQKWGFNTVGSWSGNYAAEYGMPHVNMLPTSSMDWAQVDGMHYFDIFADGAEQKIDEAFAAKLPANRDDPTLIGYFIDNEIQYQNILTVIPQAKASKVASKRKLVDLLSEWYNGDISAFNSAWGTSFASFDEMYEAALPVKTQQAQDDLYSFVSVYADTLYGTIATIFRKYDPNHLLLGDRWLKNTVQNARIRDILSEAAGKYLDVISYNYYSKNLSVSQLQAIHDKSGGKPIMITEFNYGTAEQGLNSGVIPVETQDERQLRYRNYVELAASLGYVVGTHWFNYVDQPAAGRWWEGTTGERYNTGLINVADRPYKQFLQGVKQSNDEIYDVLLGNREPFQYDFGEVERPANRTIDIAYTSSPMLIDGIRDEGYDSSHQVRLKYGDLVVGTGGSDMQAGYDFAWDQSNLYVFADVTDPTPMKNPFRDSNVWKGDGVELFVGPDQLDVRQGLLVSDRQLILSAGADDGSYYWRWFNTSQQSPISMVVRKHDDGGGYSLEASIPWEALSLTPEEGKSLLFDFGFDDSEDGVRRIRQWLWNGMDGNASNRGYWGTATLTGGPDRLIQPQAPLARALE